MIKLNEDKIRLPEVFLSNLFIQHNVEKCELSVYDPNLGMLQNRETYVIDANEFLDHFNSLQIRLKSNQEIAIHSKVSKLEGNFHMPMINFSKKRLAKADYAEVKKIMRDCAIGSVAIFDSGNSYHLYSRWLVSGRRWEEFMGAVIANKRKNLVDYQWIGSCIQLKHNLLRLTNNSGMYKKVPELVGNIDI